MLGKLNKKESPSGLISDVDSWRLQAQLITKELNELMEAVPVGYRAEVKTRQVPICQDGSSELFTSEYYILFYSTARPECIGISQEPRTISLATPATRGCSVIDLGSEPEG